MEIKKRNGEIVIFDKDKISDAIVKAMLETDSVDIMLATKIACDIEIQIKENYKDDIVTVEEVQDMVEEQLMETRKDVAKRYILYREERRKVREKGWNLDELQTDIWKGKYQFENETFDEFLDRVSNGNEKIRKIMLDKEFLFAGRILANRGLQKHGKKITYSNCYVVKAPEDNIESILDSAKEMARTFSYGGGCGISLRNLRPRGSKINNAAEETTGSVSFMHLYDVVTDTISQKGRRGALMIELPINHPDIEEFINVKLDLDKITKANISIRMYDDFMRAYQENKDYKLSFDVKETDEKIEKLIEPNEILRQIATNNYKMGEPGMLFQDRIDSWHMLSEEPSFEYESVNPCVTGDTLIQTVEGEIPIKDLVGTKPYVYTMDDNGELNIKQAIKVWKTRENAELVKVIHHRGELVCTPDHLIYTRNRGWVKAIDLKPKDKLNGLGKSMKNERRVVVKLSSGKTYIPEHRFILSNFEDIKNKDIHHINNNPLDNRLSNLEALEHGQHSTITNAGHKPFAEQCKKTGKFLKKDEKKQRKQFEVNKDITGKNFIVKEIKILQNKEDVYDMTVEGTHNFIANGIVVHNCAEEPLVRHGNCLLGSINLSEFVLDPFTSKARVPIDKLSYVVRQAVIALNEVLEEGIPLHPLKEQREASERWRPIGLGVMGFADMLIKLGISYGSYECLELSNLLGRVILNEAVRQSALIAKEAGTYPGYTKNILKSPFFIENLDPDVKKLVEKYGMRNSHVLSIAPTGSISTMLGISGGIEPLFATSYERRTQSLHDEDIKYKVYPHIIKEVMNNLDVNEESLPDYIVTAHNIHWVDRINTQSVWQKYIDASISSTINLPEESTIDEIENLYYYAWKTGCKGVTIYRNNCDREGILTVETKEDNNKCKNCGAELEHKEGCISCPSCGWGACTL